jgi:hypothetical protein
MKMASPEQNLAQIEYTRKRLNINAILLIIINIVNLLFFIASTVIWYFMAESGLYFDHELSVAFRVESSIATVFYGLSLIALLFLAINLITFKRSLQEIEGKIDASSTTLFLASLFGIILHIFNLIPMSNETYFNFLDYFYGLRMLVALLFVIGFYFLYRIEVFLHDFGYYGKKARPLPLIFGLIILMLFVAQFALSLGEQPIIPVTILRISLPFTILEFGSLIVAMIYFKSRVSSIKKGKK